MAVAVAVVVVAAAAMLSSHTPVTVVAFAVFCPPLPPLVSGGNSSPHLSSLSLSLWRRSSKFPLPLVLRIVRTTRPPCQKGIFLWAREKGERETGLFLLIWPRANDIGTKQLGDKQQQ